MNALFKTDFYRMTGNEWKVNLSNICKFIFNIISDLCIITESIHKTIEFTANIKFIDIAENMA